MTLTTAVLLLLATIAAAFVSRWIIDIGDALRLQALRDEAED